MTRRLAARRHDRPAAVVPQLDALAVSDRGGPDTSGPPRLDEREADLPDVRGTLRWPQGLRRRLPAAQGRKYWSNRHGPITRPAAASPPHAAYRRRFAVPRLATGWLAGRMEGHRDGGRGCSREGKPRRATGLTRWQRRWRQRTLPRSKALKTAGPARRGATCNVKRATVDGDVGAAVEAGKALEGRAPEGKHAAPIRYRAPGGNTVNPMVGCRMQQACEPPVEQSGKAVRNREVGTSRPHGCGRPKAP